jgi:hypothetical protein
MKPITRLAIIKKAAPLILAALSSLSLSAQVIENRVTVRGEEILQNGEATKIVGLRCSNALISDAATSDLIEALDVFRGYGVNTISVFVMGSRFGDVKGYRPDGTLDPVHRDRLLRILEATRDKQMITIVGCLYWGTSRASEDLSSWTQADANRAVANTARWLGENAFHHVILDPDNEGMALQRMQWEPELLIAAAKAVNPELVVANNTRRQTPNEDLNMHFGEPETGKPWFDSESTPKDVPIIGSPAADTPVPGSYWKEFSRETHEARSSYWNYSRIGRYTAEMKADQIALTRELVEDHSGIVLASTWLQCGPGEGVGGPFSATGGRSNLGSGEDQSAPWNEDIDVLHPDAGVLWWLEYVRDHYAERGTLRPAD